MTNKKIIIVSSVVILIGLLLYSLSVISVMKNQTNIPAVSDNTIPPQKAIIENKTANGLNNTYKDANYGFGFEYPKYANITIDNKISDSVIKIINVNMDTLQGLNPIITLKISNTKLYQNNPTHATVKTDKVGDATVNRYDLGIAGGEFVTYEIALKNNQYLYIETDKHFVDNEFSDIFQGDQLKELQHGAKVFQLIKSSFFFNVN